MVCVTLQYWAQIKSVLAGQVESTWECEKISGATWNLFRSYKSKANNCGRSQLDSRGISWVLLWLLWVFPDLKVPCRFAWAHSPWSQLDFFIPSPSHTESSQNLLKTTCQLWKRILSHACWTKTVTRIWDMDNPQPNSIIVDKNISKLFKKIIIY